MKYHDELAWRAGTEQPRSPSSWAQHSRIAGKRKSWLCRLLGR